MKSRLFVTDAERAQLWDVVAGHKKRLGDMPGARMACWTAKSIRNDLPINRRPEEMRP